MKIILLLVGHIENKPLQMLSEVYLKRIRHYVPVDIETVKPERMKSLSDAEILVREASKLLKRMDSGVYNVALDSSGKPFSSKELALEFNRIAAHSTKTIQYVIGGPLGLHNNVTAAADMTMSLSRMTFPHELAAVMLLEQIYRAQTILKGESYHK